MRHYVLSRIWRNFHRDIKIDNNRRSEEFLKLRAGQNTFIFRREGVSLLGEGQKSFIFRKGLPLSGGRGNFLGGGLYVSAYDGQTYMIVVWILLKKLFSHFSKMQSCKGPRIFQFKKNFVLNNLQLSKKSALIF